jgi:hypothetical protein
MDVSGGELLPMGVTSRRQTRGRFKEIQDINKKLRNSLKPKYLEIKSQLNGNTGIVWTSPRDELLAGKHNVVPT